ncbi:permease-like cell division protein FtsX [Buchananella felis]|uniref:permease-like cell division protein FtsX n=1 Tax=Buchananella felis TaxID=3231492 RepID=UPI003526C7CC
MRLRVIIAHTFQGLWANKAMAVGLMLVTLVSSLFAGAALLLNLQTGYMRDSWFDKVEITAFMCAPGDQADTCTHGEATQEQIDAVAAFLASDAMKPYVANVEFEDKDEAFANFQRMFKGTDLAQFGDKEALPVSFRISLIDPREYRVVAEELVGRDGVFQVRDQKAVVDPLLNVLSRAQGVSIALAAAMGLAAAILIATTIKLSSISRQKDVEILRLVGASRWFIQVPFLLEVAFSVLIGAAVSVGTLWVTVRFYVNSWLGGSFTTMRFVDARDVAMMAPWLLGGALLLAVGVSMISLNREVKA